MKSIPSDWYQQAFGADYLERYAHRDQKEAERQVSWLIERLSLKPSMKILDACCGAGRHLKVLRDKGFEAFGFDLSRDLLKEVPAPSVQADQRNWPFAPQSLDAVIVMFTSLGYFEDDRDNLRLFDEIARCLKAGGVFLIDAANPEKVRENLVPKTEKVCPGGILKEERWFQENRICKEIIWKTSTGNHHYFESVRLFEKEEFETICSDRRLNIQDIKEGIPPQTGRLLICGRKR